MSDDWGDYAKEWDSPDTRLYANQVFDTWTKNVATLVPELSECRILDFGCGTGLLTEKIAPLCAQVVAVDTSDRMVDELRQKISGGSLSNVTPLTIDVDSSSVKTSPELSIKFDLIVASSVCSFLPDYNSTLQVLSSLLKSGGVFAQWDWLSEMPVERIAGAFESAGLDSVGIETSFDMSAKGETALVVSGIGRRP
jgi:2-polyprenyl-3-methyl-5-hydroxy-6-metoxy-1,4-benzoquinol methylase